MIKSVLALCMGLLLCSSFTYSQTILPDSANPFLREPRLAAVSGELGMNSLSSMAGVVVHFYATPQAAIDLGIGLSAVGLRTGVRARYNFTMKKTSPFIGVAYKYGLGTGSTDFEVEDPETKEKLRIKTKGSPFLDVMFGLDYQAHNGFLLIASVGYSALLGGDNVEVTQGKPSEDAKKVFDIVYGSGIGLSVSLGKAF